MNYLDVYFSRVNHLGETPIERRKNTAIRNFERWLAESPYTIENLSVERGLYFNGIIQTNKDREEKKIMLLYVSIDIPIQVGDILNWEQDDGKLEKWILISKEKRVHEPYQIFSIVKCNYEIKWIDAQGRLKKSWSYVVSSTDDKIKGNYRTWHNLISPQPNKYAEILMPKQMVDRGTNFIIEDEGWKLIEADFTSVEGIIYMSLTENKVNYQYDDREIDVADVDKLAFPVLQPIYYIGNYIIPDFGENTFNEWEIELIPEPEDTDIIKKTDEYWQAVKSGKVVLYMQLKGNKAIQKRFEVEIVENDIVFSAYIDGPDTLRLDRFATYTFTPNIDLVNMPVFELEETELATIINCTNNECVVRANAKNKLGEIILKAVYDGKTYTKQIKIISLW